MREKNNDEVEKQMKLKLTYSRIVTNNLLESMPEVEQSFGGGSREVTTSELKNLQPPKRQERQRGGIPDGRLQDRNNLEGSEKTKDPTELLECAMITEVGDVSTEVIDGGTEEETLKLMKGFEP